MAESVAEATEEALLSLRKVNLSADTSSDLKGVSKSIQKIFEEAEAKFVEEEIEAEDHPDSFFETHSIANLLGER